MHWAEFAERQPRFAELGLRRLADPGVVLVGTVRADGTPRISPVEALFWHGQLWLPMMWDSRKAADLDRDSRVLVHNAVPDRDGSLGTYQVRGRAVAEPDLTEQRGFAEEAFRRLGWRPEPGRMRLFRMDVAAVSFVRYDAATGDQFTTLWPRGVEFVRRATSATSVGPRQPHPDPLLIDPDV